MNTSLGYGTFQKICLNKCDTDSNQCKPCHNQYSYRSVLSDANPEESAQGLPKPADTRPNHWATGHIPDLVIFIHLQ